MSLRFLVLGDLHYDTPALRPDEPENAYHEMWRERAPRLLDAAAAAARREGASFALQLGDLANAPFGDWPLLGAPVKVHDRPAVWARVRLDQPNVTRAGAKPGIRGTGFRVSGSASGVIRVLFLIDIPAVFL